uniref:DUF859 family phage minor structural protein n=1 Tax=Ndongobacter massiliensis TaxID=1871025 RepID=UPI000931E56C|nr:DUF859 family phage minor structural protein [Ndongobacter massiliensis]
MAQFTYYGSWENVDVRYSVSQNQAANTTTITADAYHRRPGAGGGSYEYSGVNFALTIAGNTKSRSWTWDRLPSGGERLILSHSVTIPHNSDGSHAPVSIAIYCATGSSSLGTVSASQSISLATIPRAASTSVDKTTVTIGEYGPIVTVDRKNASFKHKLFLNLNGTDKRYYYPYDIPSGLGKTTIQFNPPIWLCEWVPNAESMMCTLGVYTYQADGKTPVGATGVNIRLDVPKGVQPTIKSHEVKPIKNGMDGNYWQNHTFAGVSFTWGLWRADQLFGAQVDTVQFYADGALQTFTRSKNAALFKADSTGISATFTTHQVGLRGYKIVLTDTRGRTAVAEGTYPVVTYFPPQILSCTAERSDSAGNPDPSGAYARLSCKIRLSKTYDNFGKLRVQRSDGNTTEQVLSESNIKIWDSDAFTITRVDVNVLLDKTYTYTFTLSDKATKAEPRTARIGPGEILMDLSPHGFSAGCPAKDYEASLRQGNYMLTVGKNSGIRAKEYNGGTPLREVDLLGLAGIRGIRITKTINSGFINLTNDDLGIGQGEALNYTWGIQPVYEPDAGIMYTTIQPTVNGMYVYIRSELSSKRPPDGLNITLHIMRF